MDFFFLVYLVLANCLSVSCLSRKKSKFKWVISFNVFVLWNIVFGLNVVYFSVADKRERNKSRMEKEGKNQSQRAKETTTDFVLKWGNRKRLRCCKVKKESKNLENIDDSCNNNNNNKNKSGPDCLSKKKFSSSRVVSLEKGSPNRLNK